MSVFKIIPSPLTAQELERIADRIHYGTDFECWEWQAKRDKDGYGIIALRRENYRVHRVVYRMTFRHDPEHLLVRHTCDNPPCCNPRHLVLGDAADNSSDAVARHRTLKGDNHPRRKNPERWPRGDAHWSRRKPECLARGNANGANTHPEKRQRGEGHHRAKFTENDIRNIRTLHSAGTHSYSKLGQMYGVDWRYICRIVKRKLWKHMD